MSNQDTIKEMESILREIKIITTDIFIIKNELKCIKDLIIQKKNEEVIITIKDPVKNTSWW